MRPKSDFLSIDPLRLDEEWLKQPSLYFQYAADLADARQVHDEAKSNLDVVAAEVDSEIREDPEAYNIVKVSEAAIKAAVSQSKEYKIASKQVNKARHRVDILQAAVTALEHKKRALTMLVELHGQNYFADPKITASSGAREAVEDQRKERVRRLGKKKRRRDDARIDTDED